MDGVDHRQLLVLKAKTVDFMASPMDGSINQSQHLCPYPKDEESLERVSIRSLKLRNRETEEAIQEKRKLEENKARKVEFNKLIKDHLKYNKKIVMTLLSHKVGEEARQLREKKGQLNLLTQVQRDALAEENAEKANRIRIQHIEAHQKRKMYFLDKLHQFKQFKEQKLREELRQREKQEALISQLQEKERVLLERLSVSEQFRQKCQHEYEQARSKYHSFNEASKGQVAQEQSEENKAQIFIS